MTYYWNRADRGVAHATMFRDALCGTHMGYGSLTWAWADDRKCQRCVKALAKRGETAQTR